ncbi:MAG: hypothetical protein ACREIU_06285, partial [Planctomycetota bacterium]
DAASAPTGEAEARFLEWFLFERPSTRYGEVPYLTFLRRFEEDLSVPLRDMLEGMAENVFGVFEVESHVPGSGMSVTDLLRGRALAVREEQTLVEVGDTLVGRLFPIPGSSTLEGEEFLLSSAVACFRSRELRDALGADLARAHAASPRARLSQRGIERLLWPAPAPAADGLETEIRALLDVAGLPEMLFEDLRRSFAEAPRPGPVIGALLDRLAFETRVDLDRARTALWSLWEDSHREAAETEETPPAPTRIGAQPANARAAVEAFERGRARGENLEELFFRLERDLDLAGEPDAEEDPDPALEGTAGNLGPLLEEHLWERSRDASRPPASEAGLRSFARYLSDRVVPPLDLLECLEPEHLRRFARDVLHPASSPSAQAEALDTLAAVEEFLRWGRAEQGIDALGLCESALRSLDSDLRRSFAVRAATAPTAGRAPASPDRFLVRLAPVSGAGELVVDHADGSFADPIHARVDPALAPHLREGDLLAGTLSPGTGAPRDLRVSDLIPAGLRGAD